MEWSAEEEINLFFALEGLKPVGINKYFYITCIVDRLSTSLNRDMTAELVWRHLRTLYNLDILNEMEPYPFPNETDDFTLPDIEFSLLSRKRAEDKGRRLGSDFSSRIATPQVSPPSISFVTDTTKDKIVTSKISVLQIKEIEKKIAGKFGEAPKRTHKRIRGSMSLESNSPSTTPPPIQSNKRRRI